jgi:hypothetical protein
VRRRAVMKQLSAWARPCQGSAGVRRLGPPHTL